MVGNKGQVTILGLLVMFLVGVSGFLIYHTYLAGATQNIVVKVESAQKRKKCHFTLFSAYQDYIKYGGAKRLEGKKHMLESFYENMSGEQFPIVRFSKRADLYESFHTGVSIYEGKGGICEVKVFDPYRLYREKFMPYRTITMVEK